VCGVRRRSGSCDTTVKKWNLATSQCELTMSKGRTGAINDLCFIDGLKGTGTAHVARAR
jgi:hypothetical protein